MFQTFTSHQDCTTLVFQGPSQHFPNRWHSPETTDKYLLIHPSNTEFVGILINHKTHHLNILAFQIQLIKPYSVHLRRVGIDNHYRIAKTIGILTWKAIWNLMRHDRYPLSRACQAYNVETRPLSYHQESLVISVGFPQIPELVLVPHILSHFVMNNYIF